MRASDKQPSTIPTTGYIRRFRLPELLGVSMPTIDRWVKNGTLPRPIKLTENVTAFDAGRWPDAKRKPPITGG